MTGRHEAFAAWLIDGARADLPRDVALHASACDDCLRRADAFDALLAVDAGAASPPPFRSALPRSALASTRTARFAAGVIAVLALAVAVGIGAGGLVPEPADPGVAEATPTPLGEGILGGAGGPSDAPPSTPVPVRPARRARAPAPPRSRPASQRPPPWPPPRSPRARGVRGSSRHRPRRSSSRQPARRGRQPLHRRHGRRRQRRPACPHRFRPRFPPRRPRPFRRRCRLPCPMTARTASTTTAICWSMPSTRAVSWTETRARPDRRRYLSRVSVEAIAAWAAASRATGTRNGEQDT